MKNLWCDSDWDNKLSIGNLVTLACLLEVSAAKPGNVHRGADFEDVTFMDFQLSAVALGGTVANHLDQPVGKIILNGVKSTRKVVQTNTNLGMILLLVPLAKCLHQFGQLDRTSMARLLGLLDSQDSGDVYEAIRMAKPGGLGDSKQHDIQGTAPANLMEAMHLSADRDLVARQFANHFEDVFATVLPFLVESRNLFQSLDHAIIHAFVKLLSQQRDTLIERKNGTELAEQARIRALRCIDACQESHEAYWKQVAEFDFWLRSDGHQRNPGATADLIAAGLFVGLATEKIKPDGK